MFQAACHLALARKIEVAMVAKVKMSGSWAMLYWFKLNSRKNERMNMQIILWRHAEAEMGQDDLARFLTEKGKRQAMQMAEILRNRLPENHRVWVSQAARSQQTASFLTLNLEVFSELNPEQNAQSVAKLLFGQPEDDTIVIVGHQPWIGELCAFLLNQSWQTQAYWSVKKGAFWWFSAHESDGVFLCKLKTMLTP